MGAAEEEPMQGPNVSEERILVSIRLRPLNEKEIARNDVSDWECINTNTIIHRNNLSAPDRSMYPAAYTYDKVFGPDCSTRHVYEEGAKEVALSVVRGINSSVFAYGQTSSGKTYTMSGITEYTIAEIYDYMEKQNKREFVLKFSAMEIYNESVRDLLSADTTPLRLLDDPERGTVVERLTEETLRDWHHFKELLSICEAQRQIGETLLNEASSRSHQILRVTIESSALEFLGNDNSSTLAATVNFVDLAGSERASQMMSAGQRLKEGCHINRSLLSLGTVIRKLSKGKSGHVPFRDSKLTRILQSSLGGNSRTAIICTMSPARSQVEQSRNTLLFASCAKEVTTNARVNVVMTDKALVRQLQKELARLEVELRNTGRNSGSSESIELLKKKDLQIEKLSKQVAELTRKLDLAQSQVEGLKESTEDFSPVAIWADIDHHYPKLRVRNSWISETSVSHSPISEDPHSLDVALKSFEASQCSEGCSTANSEETFVPFANLVQNFPRTNSSSRLSVSTPNLYRKDLQEKDNEEQSPENLGKLYKDVQCVKVEESSISRYKKSNMSMSSPNIYTGSNMSSPNINTGTSGLTEIKNEEKSNQESRSYPVMEQKELNHFPTDFIVPSPERPIPWPQEEGNPSTRSLKLMRSRSCRARLLCSSPVYCFEKAEKNENTPSIGLEKDFTRTPKCCKRNSAFNCDFVIESRTSLSSAVVDEHKVQNFDSDAGMMCMADGLAPEGVLSAKSVKDVGLDPIQDDGDSNPKWSIEFHRLQRELINLWNACNVSLVHRTYFFLLFKGDPTDSFYMEVEQRRLSFLKDMFSQGDRSMIDGEMLNPTLSKRALNQERQMLSRQMQKKFSTEERENLFLRWGIPLSGKHRRLQLAHFLWTKTTDMNHIRESADIVAKLVGFEEQQQAFKEMFGLLHITPKSPNRRKFSIWRSSIFSSTHL